MSGMSVDAEIKDHVNLMEDEKRVRPEILDPGLTIAYNGCTCMCHKMPGVMHCRPCCSPPRECWDCIHIEREPDGSTAPFCYEDGCCGSDVSTVKGGCSKVELSTGE